MGFNKYAYYSKGNQIAIIKSDTNSSGGRLAVAHCTVGGHSTKDTCEAAGGQWIPSSSGFSSSSKEKYTSPTETVTDGIEIEFSYAPNYNLSTSNSSTYYFSGYGSNGHNLVLFSDEDMSNIYVADEYILINEGPYSGLHQIKTTPASASKVLVTKTVFEPTPSMMSLNVDLFTNESIGGNASADNVKIENFKAQLPSGTNYIFINLTVDAGNDKLFSLETPETNYLKVDKEYDFNDSTLVWDESNANLSSETNDAVEIYHAYKKALSIRKADYMTDESFDLDLTPYQSQALIYYVKAKMSEDSRDIEGREYFMRLFRKQIEKSKSSKKRGPYMVQGNSNLI